MTIWARDADTGMATWVYQMTPHDEWDSECRDELAPSLQRGHELGRLRAVSPDA
jgi:glucose dehydrogenase